MFGIDKARSQIDTRTVQAGTLNLSKSRKRAVGSRFIVGPAFMAPGARDGLAWDISPRPGAMMSFNDQNQKYHPFTAALACHPERSEGSLSMGTEMLSEAKHDIPGVGGKVHHRGPDIYGVWGGGAKDR